MNAKSGKREKVHALEEEFSKLEYEILVQKQLEEQKNEIRKNIDIFIAERDNLLSAKDSLNP